MQFAATYAMWTATRTMDAQGLLTISGTGVMQDYYFVSTDKDGNSISDAPWFVHQNKIKKLYIESGVTTIGSRAFAYCDNLTDITFADSVTNISVYAFYSCDGLTQIALPDSLTQIGGSAFAYCRGLTSVTIGENVTYISNWVFSSCSDLTQIHYKGTMAQWEVITKYGEWNVNTGNYTVHCTDGEITK